ncbi:MAG TPA: NHL repeat-containing protein [Phycisphaerae bacterium]|nr:NHL repeat-containing protein [Phycisphaerae bacterium]HNU44674.1 NHL repeat-containing protein [Phycisphaerae bacterium]
MYSTRLIHALAFALNVAVCAAPAQTRADALELWVADGGWGWRFDGYTGSSLGRVLSDTPLQTGMYGFTLGLDGNLYFADQLSDRVLRYDGETRQFMDVFVETGSGGIDAPTKLEFGPDGNLYVAGGLSNNVIRYDGQTGAFLDVFAFEGLNMPEGMSFGADGDLYVTSHDNDRLLRYDGQTGQLQQIVAEGAYLDGPTDLLFGPDGLLYVSNRWTGSVARYDPVTGDALGYFVQPHSGSLNWASGVAFGPHDGNLYVADPLPARIRRYDGQTGAFIDNFITYAFLDGPNYIAFVPEPGSLLLLAAGVLLLGRKRRA